MSALLIAMPAPTRLSRQERLERELLQRILAAGWLTHAALAHVCGVSERAVGAWLSGLRPVPRGLLLAALAGLDRPRRRLTLHWLDEALAQPDQLSLLGESDAREAIGLAALSLIGARLRQDDAGFERALVALEEAISRHRSTLREDG